ncbi:MAG: UDP-N-acetylglucosamine 1-carboxyvinyltransferase [Candidatus Omnitrophica bacterium]|nr:UDP-N-acetylglucosamine 1-carboxyvinyltransferase [Candidatus Omnitrophota bacterium]
MDYVEIKGGQPLRGTVQVSGSKNATLPILAACLLTSKTSVIRGYPHLRDVDTMIRILRALGVSVRVSYQRIEVTPGKSRKFVAPYGLVSTMRASICVLGPLLARQHKAQVSLPGGCVIGPRPIDLHLKGLKALGAQIRIEHGYVVAEAKVLKGSDIYLGGHFGSSVLATGNVIMASVFAKGRTLIEDAATEPEVVDLAEFLNKMGARVQGAGTHVIQVDGVDRLHGADHTVIPDRIEAGTFIVGAAVTGGDVTIKNCRLGHLNAAVDKLQQAGVDFVRSDGALRVRAPRRLKPVDVTTLPYPGFPTDMQAQMMALMSVTPGISVITEKVYPDRFMHVSELNRMGSHIFLEGSSAIVNGVKSLSGAQVMASDLRASAALVLAGLVAEGKTLVSRVYHLDRGYETLEQKLVQLGAQVRRIKK